MLLLTSVGRNQNPGSNLEATCKFQQNLHFPSSVFIQPFSWDLTPFPDRGRSPQPPAEEDEDDFDDTLVAIDTCESLGCLILLCSQYWETGM